MYVLWVGYPFVNEKPVRDDDDNGSERVFN